MTKLACQFSVCVSRWKIATNKQLTEFDWQQGEVYWAENATNWQDLAPKLAFLPAIKRRRLGDCARLFFEAAWELLPDEQANIPVVYVSNNGEINRSFALWESLLKEGDVSPTSFSLSVHNAVIGQWSEFRQVTQEMTALSAKADPLETALIEAHLLLQEGNERVLVVVAENPLSEHYNAAPIIRTPFAYALALVLEKNPSEQSEQFQLTLTENNGEQAVEFPQHSALFWVQQQALKTTQWQTPSSTKGCWQWIRK